MFVDLMAKCSNLGIINRNYFNVKHTAACFRGISGSHGGEHEDASLLGFAPCSVVKLTNDKYTHRHDDGGSKLFRTSVNCCQTTRRNISEDCHLDASFINLYLIQSTQASLNGPGVLHTRGNNKCKYFGCKALCNKSLARRRQRWCDV
jgi:hypothetical protein